MVGLTIQSHFDGAWHDAAGVAVKDRLRGIASPTAFSYEDPYVFAHLTAEELAENRAVVDRRAVSLNLPVDLEFRKRAEWPAFLLDMMPQGAARLAFTQTLGIPPDSPAVELPLLMRAGGGPIGNLRIREAYEEERRRIESTDCPPLSDQDVATRSELFIDVVNRFALETSGSSAQGEWPKALLTRRAGDGCWYPDAFVDDRDALDHVIVKLLRSTDAGDRLILAAEAPYQRVAGEFGLRIGRPMIYHRPGVLVMPRFDREVRGGTTVRHGQESAVSALGVARFGYQGVHEDYIDLIRLWSDRPAEDIVQYVLRDVLNMAMGNPDNHGRNTAFAKPAGGGVHLTPLFDFTPMRLSRSEIGRSTRWRCLNGRDVDPDWRLVCDVAAGDTLPAAALRASLAAKAGFLRDLPAIAARAGVAGEVIAGACTRHDDVGRALEVL